jgi:ribosome maturation factor RimP
LDIVAELSRSASSLLDAKRDIGGTYVLEVSSPGVDRPLTSEKHFRRARARKVDLTLTDGTQVTGRVAETRDGVVDVVVRDRRDWTVRPIPLSDVAKAVVQVEFSQPPQRELELAGVDRADRGAETEGRT